MKTYPVEFKSALIARMLPPNNVSVPELSKQTGIPQDTLYAWRLRARGRGSQVGLAGSDQRGLSSEDKFNIVLETATMNQEELSAYCRQKGLYPDQISDWKQQCIKANEPVAPKVDKNKIKEQEKENQQLKAELRRKEKALVETAVLLVLKKKVQQIWGDPEDE